MSPSAWCGLSAKRFSLSNIWESRLKPDLLRCWLTDCGLHMGYQRHGRPPVTLAQLLAERARVEAAIDAVLARDYGGAIGPEDDYCSSDEDEDADEESEGESEGGEEDGEEDGEEGGEESH